MKLFKKRYILTLLASAFLFIGVSFKEDFFEIAKQIEIFTTLFKTVNQNYVDETNPSELMDKAIKSMLADKQYRRIHRYWSNDNSQRR